MKILMGSSYFDSHNGGLEIVAGMLFKEFSALGQEVVWMAGDITPSPEPVGCSRAVSLHIWNFVEDKTGIPFPIPSPASLNTILREMKNAEVLVLHDCLYLSNIFALLAAKWRGVPTLIIQHVGFIPYRSLIPNLILRLGNTVVTRPILARASQVVFIGEATRRFFKDVPFRGTPLVIFNGVDTEMFHPLDPSEEVQELRRHYSLPETGTVMLFVGRFVEKKGMRAMREMAAMRPDWTWAFAGWGPMDPREWGLENVRVLSGLRGATLAPLYRCCDLLVLSSTGEGFPLVIQEALASGLPVVCSEDTLDADVALRDVVAAARGLTDDSEQTARAFITVLDVVHSHETYDGPRTSQRRDFAADRYSWRKAAERYLEALTTLFLGTDGRSLRSKNTGEGLPR